MYIRRTIHVSLFDLETESIKSVIDCFYSVYLHRKGKNNEVEVVESILRECGGVSVLPYHFEKWSIESHIVKVSDIQFVGAKCNNELKDMHQLLFKDAENRK